MKKAKLRRVQKFVKEIQRTLNPKLKGKVVVEGKRVYLITNVGGTRIRIDRAVSRIQSLDANKEHRAEAGGEQGTATSCNDLESPPAADAAETPI